MSWVKHARIGQKIVCVLEFRECNNPESSVIPPSPGDVCEIHGIIVDPFAYSGVALDIGVKDAASANGIALFDAANFRPIQDTTKQVEALKRLVFPADEREGV